MLSQKQMVDLAARLKQATETLSLEWYLASGTYNDGIMRCHKTGHCVGSAILTTTIPNARTQFFLYNNHSDYDSLGITSGDAFHVVSAGDNWSPEKCSSHHVPYFESVVTLRNLFLEAVGLTNANAITNAV